MSDYVLVGVGDKVYDVELRCSVETNRGWESANMEEIPIENLIEALKVML